ncbi:MAG: hypothetical protein AAFU65_00275 [Pseudomonadota bacterium]
MNERVKQSTASVAQVHRRLEQDAAGLDDSTVAALKAARERALAAQPETPVAWPVWGGALAASVALVTVVGLVMSQRGDPVSDQPLQADRVDLARAQAVMTDLDLLADDTELAIIEDLDFLAWLSTVDEEIS